MYGFRTRTQTRFFHQTRFLCTHATRYGPPTSIYHLTRVTS